MEIVQHIEAKDNQILIICWIINWNDWDDRVYSSYLFSIKYNILYIYCWGVRYYCFKLGWSSNWISAFCSSYVRMEWKIFQNSRGTSKYFGLWKSWKDLYNRLWQRESCNLIDSSQKIYWKGKLKIWKSKILFKNIYKNNNLNKIIVRVKTYARKFK